MGKFLVICLFIFLTACNSGLPVEGEFPDTVLTNQNGKEFSFSDLEGKVVVVSYIYTNCPDICHIISARMNTFKNRLKGENIQDKVHFVSISIDPARDTPEALRQHTKMMNLDLTNWVFVTGDEYLINSTIQAVGMEAMKGPVEYSGDGKPSYLISHRNRISLVDEEGKIRKHYRATTFDMDELLGDIKSLI